jgi:predicted MFS family arabinose efflux permease
VPRLERDRLTWLTYLQFGTFGYFLYGFGPTVPLLRDEQGISRTLSGLHGTALAVGALVAAVVTAGVVSRWGRAVALWSGVVLLSAGVVLYVGWLALPVTLLGALLSSVGGSAITIAAPPTLTDRHGAAGAAAISEANGVAAAAGLLAPLLIGLAVATGVGWRAGPLLVPLLAGVLFLAFRGTPVPRPSQPPEHHAGSRRLPARFWIGWGVLGALISVEFCLTLWAGDALRTRNGLGPAAATAAVTGLVAGMCAGRFGGSRLSLRVGADRLLTLAIATAGAGFLLFWLSPWAPAAVLGLLVCGTGLALHYPLGIWRVIDAAEGRPDLATARAGYAAALAVGVGPFALGALADRVGLHTAFVVVPVLLALAALGVRVGGRSRFGALAG